MRSSHGVTDRSGPQKRETLRSVLSALPRLPPVAPAIHVERWLRTAPSSLGASMHSLAVFTLEGTSPLEPVHLGILLSSHPSLSPDIQRNSRFKVKTLDHMRTNQECERLGTLGIKSPSASGTGNHKGKQDSCV